MGDVVDFPGMVYVDAEPAEALEVAKEWGLTRVVIVGTDESGSLRWGGSFSDAEMLYWLLSLAKHQIMRSVEDRLGTLDIQR